MNDDYHRTIADHAFEAIGFLLSTFLKLISLYLAVFAAFVAFRPLVDPVSPVNWQMKFLLISVSVFVVLYMWTTWYLISRGSLEYQIRLQLLSNSREDSRLSATRAKLISIGTLLSLSGTAIIGIMMVIICYL